MKTTTLATLFIPAFLMACAGPDSGRPDPPVRAAPVRKATAAPPEASPSARQVAPAFGEPVSRASNAFAFDLYDRLAATDGNLAFSPASISIALSMTAAGARTETAKQMHRVLHFPDDAGAIHRGYSALIQGWRSVDGAEVAVANRLYGQQGYAIAPAFLALNADRYGAPLQPVDFAGAPDDQRRLINGWVAKRTRERILDLIPVGGIKASTKLVLANALYFKSGWATGFDPHHTTRHAFTNADGRGTEVDMMQQVTVIDHAEVDGAVVAQLPYRDGRFAMMFAMPKSGHSLAPLEAALSHDRLDAWAGALSPKRRKLRLPRVEIKPGDAVKLSAHLAAMGMPSAFGGGADFSGIASGLFIDEVYHKAFVAIDELGTEAAAATAVVMAESGVPSLPEAIALSFDRPYLFFLRDLKSGMVVFAGRVASV
jgi:serine protease inhibitor